MCPRCFSEDETVDHLLRSYPYSVDLWLKLGLPTTSASFFSVPFNRWVSDNIRNSSSTAHADWPMQFALTCWWIWKWRNNVIFGRGDENPINPVSFLQQQFDSSKVVLDSFSIFNSAPGTSYEEIFVRWHPPPFGWFLLNTDGASRGNPGLAGCGGIIRDDSGNFVSAYLFSCGICNSMRAEMRALLTGLEHARSLRVNKLLIFMDNKTCVGFIREEQLISNGLCPLVQRCKELINLEDWTVKVDHCYREANRAADWLANQGVSSSTSTMILSDPPTDLCSILREDVLGVSISRIVAN